MFRRHHIVSATIGLTSNHSHFWYSALSVSVQKFCTMTNNATILLRCPRQESGHVHQSNNGNRKRITKSNEAGCFGGGLNIQTSGEDHRLIGNNTNRTAPHPSKAGQNIACIIGFKLKKITVINDFFNQLMHVVRLIRVVRNE